MNLSPLRYPGGKYKMYEYVAELIKENKCTTYIEPFCGGAAISLELLLQGAVQKIILKITTIILFIVFGIVFLIEQINLLI